MIVRTQYNYKRFSSVSFIYDDEDIKVFNCDTSINPKNINSSDVKQGTFTNSSKPSKLFADVTMLPFSPLEAQKFMNMDSSTAAPSSDVVTNINQNPE